MVEPSSEHALLLLQQAKTHLVSADKLLATDPAAAYTVLYDAARKAMTAVLTQQGLRPTSRSGHRATQEVIEAQLGPRARSVVRPFRALRLRRHDVEYPSAETPTVTTEETAEALDDARGIVEAMGRFLPNVGPWSRPQRRYHD